jgi:cob(I)alamin adenosyltransferase
MKIYTKTGDKGETSLFGGDRVKKSNQRIGAYGTIDELNSVMGIIRSCEIDSSIKQELIYIQNKLFTLGAELATPNEKIYLKNGKCRLPELICVDDIFFIENKIDEMDKLLAPMTHFILPGGGHFAEAFCQQARTICRRAEREVILLHQTEKIRPSILQFLNRLSDYLFVLGRFILKQNNQEAIKWIPNVNS